MQSFLFASFRQDPDPNQQNLQSWIPIISILVPTRKPSQLVWLQCALIKAQQSCCLTLCSLPVSDSGMSVSFQSGSAGSAGTVSQESSPQQQQQQLLAIRAGGGGVPRPRKLSATNMSTNLQIPSSMPLPPSLEPGHPRALFVLQPSDRMGSCQPVPYRSRTDTWLVAHSSSFSTNLQIFTHLRHTLFLATIFPVVP